MHTIQKPKSLNSKYLMPKISNRYVAAEGFLGVIMPWIRWELKQLLWICLEICLKITWAAGVVLVGKMLYNQMKGDAHALLREWLIKDEVIYSLLGKSRCAPEYLKMQNLYRSYFYIHIQRKVYIALRSFTTVLWRCLS